MEKLRTVKILKFHPGRCTGCKECEKACSQIHFKTKEGGDRSAIHITKDGNTYNMNVCDHCGLCMDVCPMGALYRRKNGIVWLDKDTCVGCQSCVAFCPVDAMRRSMARIEPFKCISCGACVRVCPEKALELVDVTINDVKRVVYYKLGVEN